MPLKLWQMLMYVMYGCVCMMYYKGAYEYINSFILYVFTQHTHTHTIAISLFVLIKSVELHTKNNNIVLQSIFGGIFNANVI